MLSLRMSTRMVLSGVMDRQRMDLASWLDQKCTSDFSADEAAAAIEHLDVNHA